MYPFDFMEIVAAFGYPGGVTVTRRGAITRSNGFPVAGSSSTFTLSPVIIQPLSGREMQHVPEGQRNREWLRVYSQTALRTAAEGNGVMADTFAYAGATYEVQSVDNWSPNANYYAYRAARVSP